MNESNDLRLLFADYVNGEISAERLQALEAALREDTDLRREFIEYLNVDSALGDLAALSEAEVDALSLSEVAPSTAPSHAMRGSDAVAVGEANLRASEPDSPQGRVKMTSRAVAFVAVVAATLLISLGIWMSQSGEDNDQTVVSRERPIAWLVTEIDALLKKEAKTWEDNRLPSGEYQLERGLLHLRLGGNVMLYIEAPARFEAVSENRVVLQRGRLSASVPPEGAGFTVQTPETEVIDFGTEFSVDVEAGASEVHVFEGHVRVQPSPRKDGESREAVDLRTSDAVKIEAATKKPVNIELASNRFIRSFDEPKLRYPHSVNELSPVAYYRMPIRVRGLYCEPSEFSGEVLTGDGFRPPHAPGAVGASLRVQAESTGRGGRVDTPPPLRSGQFTLAAFVYLETRAANGTVATNIRGDKGNFALSLDDNGLIQATIRSRDGGLLSVSGDDLLQLQTWHHLVITVDGERLRIYLNGELVASSASSLLAKSDSAPLFFGTDAERRRLWSGRIDELALFDKALTDADIAGLHQSALKEMVESK